jgi:glycosyltransferase involved in cell wall biosynthesis
MKILILHNEYQKRGGEDVVFENEVELLRNAGFDVKVLMAFNSEIIGFREKLKTFIGTPYNFSSRKEICGVLEIEKPDIVHVHNFFPKFSPSIFYACAEKGIPCVLTLHNFRLLCANALLMRDGKVCEDCVGKLPIPAVIHRCYRNSISGSVVLAGMIGLHHQFGTWKNKVSQFIALSQFSKDRFVQGGLPESKISIKPNFISDPTAEFPIQKHRNGFVFVGRLSDEKGIKVLLDCWRDQSELLTICGDGPLRGIVEAVAKQNPNIVFKGQLSKDEIFRTVAKSKAIIVPSICYEGFPMTIVEAMALGTPVICSRIGSLPQIVMHDSTGYLFKAGDPGDLALAISMLTSDPKNIEKMSKKCRDEYELLYSAQKNLNYLSKIYKDVLDNKNHMQVQKN